MPWKPWGWHWFSPSYNNVAEEEESSTAAHEEDDDIEALRFHLAPDEIVNSAFTLVDEEEEQKSAVEQQQHQYASPTRRSPRRREQGRLFTPLPQADIEEGRGGLVAGGDETSPVRSHRVVEVGNGVFHSQVKKNALTKLTKIMCPVLFLFNSYSYTLILQAITWMVTTRMICPIYQYFRVAQFRTIQKVWKGVLSQSNTVVTNRGEGL